MWKEFKAFALKGNVLDLAIGVIIGAAFNKIVTSLVNDVLMPILGLILGGMDLTKQEWKFGEAVVKYGAFLQTVIDFLIVAFSVFLFIKALNRFKRKEAEAKSASPSPSKEVELLGEIRDLLKERATKA